MGGGLLAAIPVVPALVFDTPGLEMPAFILFGLLLAVTLFTTLKAQHRVWASAGGTLFFLTLLFGPFLSKFSDSFLGTRATVAAMGHLDQGRSVALYHLRDEEMLFSLPLETEVYRRPEKLSDVPADKRNIVFCARERDFDRGFGIADADRFEVLEKVEGLDLGRGRPANTVFFRLREGQQ